MTRIWVYRPQKVFQLLLGSSLIPSLNRRTAAIGTNQEVTICIDLIIIIIIIIITDDWTYFTSIINNLTVSSWLKLTIVHCQLPVCQPLLIFFLKNWTAKLVATPKKYNSAWKVHKWMRFVYDAWTGYWLYQLLTSQYVVLLLCQVCLVLM